MKRILSCFVALLITFSCSMNCRASENEEARTGGVYGKYIFCTKEGMHTVMPEDGAYEVTTDDGVQITVSGTEAELLLVIHRISEEETECYDWMKSCLPETVVSFVPYDIYFINSSGDRKELSSGVEISISTTKEDGQVSVPSVADTEVSVLHLSYDGEVTVLSHTVKDGRVVFETIEKRGYYLLCEAETQDSTEGSTEESTEGSAEESTEGTDQESTEGSDQESTEGTTEGATGENPDTGDRNAIGLWFALMASCMLGVIATVVMKKRYGSNE